MNEVDSDMNNPHQDLEWSQALWRSWDQFQNTGNYLKSWQIHIESQLQKKSSRKFSYLKEFPQVTYELRISFPYVTGTIHFLK